MSQDDQTGSEQDGNAVRRDVRFPDTRWSLISDARATDEGKRERALSELCRLYWYPVYAFARSRGCSPPHAEDMTQDLFLKFLSRDSFRSAARDKGKLRSYLLTSMTRLLANEARRAGAAKRGTERFAAPIEREDAELRFAEEAPWSHTLAPDRQFDRRWAEAMLRHVEERLEQEHQAAGKQGAYEVLKQYIAGDGSGASYAEVAEALGMSEGAVKVAVHRLRKRFRMILNDEITQTISNPEEVEDELRQLYAALAGA